MRHTLGWINISLYSQRQLFTMNIPPPTLEREKKSYTDGNTDINGQEIAAYSIQREGKETEDDKQGSFNYLLTWLKSAWSKQTGISSSTVNTKYTNEERTILTVGLPTSLWRDNRTSPPSHLPPANSLPPLITAAAPPMEVSAEDPQITCMRILTGLLISDR